MEYSTDREDNENIKHINGQRDRVNYRQLQNWLGDDSYSNKLEELLLDVLNGGYEVKDVLADIQDWCEGEYMLDE